LVAPAARIEKRLILTTEAGKKTREAASKPVRGNQWAKEFVEEHLDPNPWKAHQLFLRQQSAQVVIRWVQYHGSG